MPRIFHRLALLTLLLSALSTPAAPAAAAASFPFSDDFEGASLDANWTAAGTGRGVATLSDTYPYSGNQGVRLWQQLAGDAVATLTLSIDLRGQSDVYLDFWWRAANWASGDSNVYISDDDGTTWTLASGMTGNSVNYTHSLVNIAGVAQANGRTLNSRFRILFQYTNAGAGGGLFIDDVRLTGRAAQVATFPITTDSFEGPQLQQGFYLQNQNAGGARLDTLSVNSGAQAIALTQPRISYGAATLVIAVDLSGQQQVFLDFWWRETAAQSVQVRGVYISDDEGLTFQLVRALPLGQRTFKHEVIDIGAAARSGGKTFTNRFWLVIQHYAPNIFGNGGGFNGLPGDGIIIDDLRLGATDPVFRTFLPLVRR